MLNKSLKDALHRAMKVNEDNKKRIHFGLAVKSANEGILLASRKRIGHREIDEAKTKLHASHVVRGTCFADGRLLVFETNQNPSPGWNTLVKKLVKDQTGMVINPEFRHGKAPEEYEEGEDLANIVQVDEGPKPSPNDPEKEAFRKRLDALRPKIEEAFKKGHPKLETMKALLAKLDELAKSQQFHIGLRVLDSLESVLAPSVKDTVGEKEPIWSGYQTDDGSDDEHDEDDEDEDDEDDEDEDDDDVPDDVEIVTPEEEAFRERLEELRPRFEEALTKGHPKLDIIKSLWAKLDELANSQKFHTGLHVLDSLKSVLAPSVKDETDDESEEDDEVFEDFNDLRGEVNEELVHLMTFLPEDLIAELNAKYDAAVRQADPNDKATTKAALKALEALREELMSQAPRFAELETIALRTRLAKKLTNQSDLLDEPKRAAFAERFKALDIDNAQNPEQQRKDLAKLDEDVTKAIVEREKEINDFIVDRSVAEPVVKQAMAMCENDPDKKAELEELVRLRDRIDLGKDEAGQLLSLQKLGELLSELLKRAKEILDEPSLSDLVQRQKQLPPSGDSLTTGEELGKGRFGAVHKLDGPPEGRAPSLVGKTFNREQDRENEEKVYALVGEHPNIAKCYGVHDIDGKSMLVMKEIKGDDLNKVCDNLEKKFRDKEISREEYLGGIQHLLKGTLSGLAHFEQCGLVHCDVKGDNIRFDEETKQPVLIDMGLVTSEGDKTGNVFLPNLAPETIVQEMYDGNNEFEVTSAWDSFAVGKLLFPLLEQMPDSPQKYQFVTGLGVKKAKLLQGAFIPEDNSVNFKNGAWNSVTKNYKGEYIAKEDDQGNPVGQTLKKTKGSGQHEPGQYRVMTDYVDFMNRLTHPDPKQRMSPTDALKHPFMTQSLTEDLDLTKLFGTKPS
jgi:serine/threonine protein kinase